MNISSLHDDSAENSIMQTITIAVSAILIAAGLVTAPGLINNARDNNATTELANIAYSQEYQLGSQGKYLDYPALLAAQEATSSEGIRGAKITPSGSVKNQTVLTCNSPTSWLASVTSSSGKTFYRSSSSANTSTNLADIKYDATCIDASKLPSPTDTGSGGNNPANPPLAGTALDDAIFANVMAYCPDPDLTADEKTWVNMQLSADETLSGYYKNDPNTVAPGGYGWVTYNESDSSFGTKIKNYYKSEGDRTPYRTDGPSSIQYDKIYDTTTCRWRDGSYTEKSSLNNGGPSSIAKSSSEIYLEYKDDNGEWDRADGPAMVLYNLDIKQITYAQYYHNGVFDESAPNIG